MFDYLRSSYDLGSQFTNTELYTKDIEEGIGGTLSNYWISPDGVLYHIDYSNTSDFIIINEGDEDYEEKRLWRNFKWVPNGNHGKIRPYMITKYITAYPPKWDGDWTVWPTLKLHFRYGKLMDYEDITGR